MRDYNKDNDRGNRFGRSEGGRDFGGRSSDRRSFGGGGEERREMFSAVCDDCGDDCQVPFRPTEGKPIYCNKCFRKNNETGGEFKRYDRGND